MAPRTKKTKRTRNNKQEQVTPGSHKRKQREEGSSSAQKTANQGDGATKRAKVDAISTGKTVSKTGADKTKASTKTTSNPGARSTSSNAKQAGGPSCRTRAASRKKESKSAADFRPTTRRFVSRTSNRSTDHGEGSPQEDTTKATDEVSQDAADECQEMESVLRLVEQQAATIAREQPLSIKEVDQAYDALLKMHKRWRGKKRQLGRRKKGEDFKLSASQVELIANRYRVARRLETTVDYEGASTNVNFNLFKGQADKLRDQENYVIAMLRMALNLQQQIDDGTTEKTSQEWVQEVVQLKLEHKADIDSLQKAIRELEGVNARLKARPQQISDESVQVTPKELEEENVRLIEENASQKKDMIEMQAQIEKMKAENSHLKGQLKLQPGAVKSLENKLEEVTADNLKLKKKVEAAEQGGIRHVLQEKLDERQAKLDEQAREQAVERARLQGQWTILNRNERQHEERVLKDMNNHTTWMREHGAILDQITGQNAELAEHERYARAQDEWDRKCRCEERGKK